MMKQNNIVITESSTDYALLDSGEGEKLERFGNRVLSRPDPQALWKKNLGSEEWKKADGVFSREEKNGARVVKAGWSLKPGTPHIWPIELAGLKFEIRPTPFKHVGIFPEQQGNWEWFKTQIENAFIPALCPPKPGEGGKAGIQNDTVEVLNLFGYTGGATLACAQAGAKVVHVDGSKSAITWARENAELSGLSDKPIRWILEDARTFVAREIKRGRTYNGIIMDPPAFGHGPENELWKIEENLLPLIEDCFRLLKDKSDSDQYNKPLFFLINGYASGYSAIAYENILRELVEKYGGTIEAGELAIQEKPASSSQPLVPRLLPCGIFTRWSR